MRAAHHFQLSDQAIRNLAKEQRSDSFVKEMYSTLMWDGPGLSDSRVFELYMAPGEGYQYDFNKGIIAVNALIIGAQCKTLSTSPGHQAQTETFCDKVSNPAEGSICQDLEDIVDFDHCDDSARAQAPHFMRATTQTTESAHSTAMAWITSNVEKSATLMASQLAARTEAKNKSIKLTGGLPSKYLGRALHALQDSFSGGHVLREQGEKFRTGPILHIYAYKFQNHDEHDQHDCATVDTGYFWDSFSDYGKVVIDASRELLWIAIQMANAKVSDAKMFNPFNNFVKKWLPLSPTWHEYKDEQTQP